jgi:hypothetical protein
MSKLGTIVSDFKRAGEAIKSFLTRAAADAPKVVAEVAADEELLVPIIEKYLPQSTTAINLGNKLFDTVAQAVEDAGEAAGANGLTVSLDEQTVNDVKSIIAAAKEFDAKQPAPVPAAS